MPLMTKRILNLISIVAIYFLQVSYRLPDFYKNFRKVTNSENSLDYVVMEFNGERKIIQANETIDFIQGDKLLIKSAALKNGSQQVEEINIVGAKHPNKQGSRNDVGHILDTSNHLDSMRWSVDADGEVYAIVVATRPVIHGAIYLRRVKPKLKYIDVRLNNKLKVYRQGESLNVRASDSFKIERVVTNLRNHENVNFEIYEIKDDKNKKDSDEAYEIRFKHFSHVFGKLPMKVKK